VRGPDEATVVNHVERSHSRALSAQFARSKKLELHTPPWRTSRAKSPRSCTGSTTMSPCPSTDPPRPHILRIGHAPVLVDTSRPAPNVGLIGRYGRRLVSRLGTVESPGARSFSAPVAVERPTVLEVALGTPLRVILESANADPDPQALLLGGYGGSWLAASHLDLNYCNEDLARASASNRRGGHRGAAARRVRGSSKHFGVGAAGWPTRVRANADPARSVYPPSPRTLNHLAHPSRDP